MIILDQNEVKGDFKYISEVHRELLMPLLFELVEEVSPLGMVILLSAGFSDDTVPKYKDVINPDLTGYDLKIGGKEYKLENITFI